MQYKIIDIQGTNLDNVLERLRIAVNISCNSGWRPQGGVSNYSFYKRVVLCLSSYGKRRIKTAKREKYICFSLFNIYF